MRRGEVLPVSEYKRCGCKDASSKNSCKGRPDCYLRAGHPERKSAPGDQDPRSWHYIYLWTPKKIYGRWYWLKWIQRMWTSDGLLPLCDAKPHKGWIYRPYPDRKW